MSSVILNTGLPSNHIFDEITEGLETNAYVSVPIALDVVSIDQIFLHMKALGDNAFKKAGIGREDAYQLNQFVRRDEIFWIPPQTKAMSSYFDWIEALRLHINKHLFLGLFDYECHFAHYPVGAFYKKHVDAFIGQSNRVVTTILYLNPNWNPEHGGELVLYAEDGIEVLETITPEYGKLVVFLSHVFPHEVLPAQNDRYSLTGWYRINNNLNGNVDPPL